MTQRRKSASISPSPGVLLNGSSMSPSNPCVSEKLYKIEVDLRGNTQFPEAEAVTLLMDGSDIGPFRLRVLTAEHYGVPIEQVGPAISTTRQAYEADVDAWF